ncbi:ATPase, histidine kinase-, DNA gyrase B-, and HSP90-like domain protein [Synechococcus sp. PCC 7335]|uniref:ATP-binding protein n=1 Tax=Synechococcus sp. (strain ATCC 29403 / PCC 7335) TaxID=91464 RepID=UPI00017ECE4A|nr:ATP-binding protein [Synechococcus sp. PCC 7335]EDX83740.1 ATPase, histidine kinase-, DNA gyrase B-, and HSP90-like domain protein [Synechococcus sp. PCC 7335]
MAIRRRSFRHNLLVKILGFSLPILFVGQVITIGKARSSLLMSAQQNLTSSAIRKAEGLETGIQAIDANIDLLAQTEAFRSNDLEAIRATLNKVIQDTTPYDISCVELKPPQSMAVINTCDRTIVPDAKQVPWLQSGSVEISDFYVFSPGVEATTGSQSNSAKTISEAALEETVSNPLSEGEAILEDSTLLEETSSEEIPKDRALIKFIVASPIYGKDNSLRYTLAMEVGLLQLQDTTPQSLVGETVVIDQNQIIVTHPDPAQVGKSIADLREADKFSSIIENIRVGKSDFIESDSLSRENENWFVAYSGFDVPVSPKQDSVWTVLAVTPSRRALHGLRAIRRVLIVWNIGLLIASISVALIVSNSLSLPIEKLTRYTQNVKDLSQLQPAPRNSHIWELDYLGTVIERMLRGLEKNSNDLRKAWQDAQTANQLKNEFLANTSHELRTPLNGIIGSIGILKDGLCDSKEEEREFLDQANKAAMHLLSVIEDILSIAKIEAGTLKMSIAPVDLRSVLHDVLEMQVFQAKQKGLLIVRPELLAPLMVEVDHFRFKQVLLNVISNAIKFTDKGTIDIQITTDESTQTAPKNCDHLSHRTLVSNAELCMPPKPWVKIMIKDSGIGIDPQHLPKLFKPFVMVDGSHTRSYEGTGLGLAISQNFMRLMQGDITLSSEGIGRGTTVTIVIPRLVREVNLEEIDKVPQTIVSDRDVAEVSTR